MQAIASALTRFSGLPRLLVGVALANWLSGCQAASAPAPRSLNIQQNWELKPGDTIANHTVTGSLGDVSIDLGGATVYAPFAGDIEPAPESHCVIYSTPEVPAYLFRFCGLRRPRYGAVRPQQPIGSGQYLQFATLRRQPDGTWIIVEPSTGILERTLDRSADASAPPAPPAAPAGEAVSP